MYHAMTRHARTSPRPKQARGTRRARARRSRAARSARPRRSRRARRAPRRRAACLSAGASCRSRCPSGARADAPPPSAPRPPRRASAAAARAAGGARPRRRRRTRRTRTAEVCSPTASPTRSAEGSIVFGAVGARRRRGEEKKRWGETGRGPTILAHAASRRVRRSRRALAPDAARRGGQDTPHLVEEVVDERRGGDRPARAERAREQPLHVVGDLGAHAAAAAAQAGAAPRSRTHDEHGERGPRERRADDVEREPEDHQPASAHAARLA